ncbi:MAG: radical SAM protein, partial [Anaerolineaceae bacterium]|nr:radical SAM protein [Anaerolineaceae bacterium]
MLVDRCNRRITYLRVSVTDRCNLRCVYCMPPEGVSWQPHESIMRYEEIGEIIRIAAEEGIREVRLTGGEPLV